MPSMHALQLQRIVRARDGISQRMLEGRVLALEAATLDSLRAPAARATQPLQMPTLATTRPRELSATGPTRRVL